MSRKDLLAKVHIAKKELGLDEDTYRDALEAETGKRSAGKCSDAQLVAVLDRFKERGWKPKRRAAEPHVRKIYALWTELRETGAVTAPKPHGFVKRMSKDAMRPEGVDRAEFLSPEQAEPIIEALKSWVRREGGHVES